MHVVARGHMADVGWGTSWRAIGIGIMVGMPGAVVTAASSGALACGGVWPVGRANSKSGFTVHAGWNCLHGLGPVYLFLIFNEFSNSSITFQMSSNMKIQNTFLLKSKIFKTWWSITSNGTNFLFVPTSKSL
jgi:hypothetical protein